MVGSFTHLCNLIIGEPMRPSLWIVDVVMGIPYGGPSDFMREMLERTELVVQRRMLAGGLDAIRKDGARELLLD